MKFLHACTFKQIKWSRIIIVYDEKRDAINLQIMRVKEFANTLVDVLSLSIHLLNYLLPLMKIATCKHRKQQWYYFTTLATIRIFFYKNVYKLSEFLLKISGFPICLDMYLCMSNVQAFCAALGQLCGILCGILSRRFYNIV